MWPSRKGQACHLWVPKIRSGKRLSFVLPVSATMKSRTSSFLRVSNSGSFRIWYTVALFVYHGYGPMFIMICIHQLTSFLFPIAPSFSLSNRAHQSINDLICDVNKRKHSRMRAKRYFHEDLVQSQLILSFNLNPKKGHSARKEIRIKDRPLTSKCCNCPAQGHFTKE